MENGVLVYVDLEGATHLVGRLWARTRGNRDSATFEYDKSWLDDRSLNNYTTNTSSILYFQRKTTGIALTSAKY